jgi:hypothetical protein
MSEAVMSGSQATGIDIYNPWPQTWTWPTTYIYPTYTYTVPAEEYANEVEVIRGEHDATIHFYRSSGPGKGRTHVKTLTLPLSLVEMLGLACLGHEPPDRVTHKETPHA